MYPFKEIEQSWQAYWETNATFRTAGPSDAPKYFVLDFFVYPSGDGLHVGHPEGQTATDIAARYKRMRGFNVMHTMGWDAFGLPAERYAMVTNIHPSITTQKNINNYLRQEKMLGMSFDWEREVNTTDPAYYKWTQWIFLKVYDSWYDRRINKARPIADLVDELQRAGCQHLQCAHTGPHISAAQWSAMSAKEQHDLLATHRLAYVTEMPVNWCAGLGTVLANEEVDEWVEKGYTVERRPLKQWMMRITAYAERLLTGLDGLQWPQSTMDMQRNWIGRSEGAEVRFTAEGSGEPIMVFTTRPDTIFGATYMVLAPEHPLVDSITTAAQRAAVDEYRARTARKSERERTAQEEKEKTGVFTGGHAINPATGKPIPVWIADYVLWGYGTGAIMAVPAHDERDFAFAQAFGLPVIEVVAANGTPSNGTLHEAFTGDGVNVNSANSEVSIDGLATADAKAKIIAWFAAKGLGTRRIQFKLRDWLFSRQRYWGEPIPILHLSDGTMKPVPERELPLLLPDLQEFKPSGTTESPLVLAHDWVNTTDPDTGLPARRETNTMPQWAGSCWYYMRYLDPKNDAIFCDPAIEKYWMPVDLYLGGAEHAVLHLLYARFWHKVLFDRGYVSTDEPFQTLVHQGTILGEDGQKMSKSRGNVVNPDDVVGTWGADAFRLFEMFMGPLEMVKPWNTKGVEGVFRFLNRAWNMIIADDGSVHASVGTTPLTRDQERVVHYTVKKVTEDIEGLRFNTAISQMMIFVNEFATAASRPREAMEKFVLVLSPFAPHLAEELWHRLGHTASLAYEPWPTFDEARAKSDVIEVVFQVNGKLRSRVQVPLDTDEATLSALADADEIMKKYAEGKQIVKKIVVKNKLVNIVVK